MRGWKTMSTIERKDLVAAVLASRDELDASLESELLENIVHGVADAAGDDEAARAAIAGAVTAAIGRGLGYVTPDSGAEHAVNDDEADDD